MNFHDFRDNALLETMREVVEVLPRHPVLSCYDGRTVRVELVRNGFEDWTLRVNLAVAYSINDVSTATTKQGTVVSVHEWAIPLEDELIKMWYFTVKGCGYVYFGVARNIQELPDQRYVIAIPAANVKIQQ